VNNIDTVAVCDTSISSLQFISGILFVTRAGPRSRTLSTVINCVLDKVNQRDIPLPAFPLYSIKYTKYKLKLNYVS